MAQCNQIQNQWSQMAFNMPMMSNNFFMSRTPNNYTRNNERNENTEKTDGSTTRSTSRPGNTVWAKMPPLGSYTPARRRRNDSNSEFIAELHPAMQEKTKELIRYCREEMGMNLKIGSGYRTRAQQRALKKDKPKLAADVSWHEFGRAVDVEINGGSDRDYARLGRYAISIGMRWGGDWDSNPKTPNRFSTERWHFEYQGR